MAHCREISHTSNSREWKSFFVLGHKQPRRETKESKRSWNYGSSRKL